MPPAARRDRSAATRLQEPGQSFLNRFRIVVYADDLSRIFDPENDRPAIRIREGADCLADGGEIETALEFGSQILSGLDARRYVRPFHVCAVGFPRSLVKNTRFREANTPEIGDSR